MSTELIYLTLTLMLAASLWIPFIVGVNMHSPVGNPFQRPPQMDALPAWVHRAHRAHLNMLETAMPFAALVLLAHMQGVSTPVTIWAAAAFFWLRVVHAAGMISGYAGMPARPIIFTLSWLCTLAIGVQILMA
ncbi:MAG: MAPEG family protein [Pseudomonadota bacterium]